MRGRGRLGGWDLIVFVTLLWVIIKVVESI
jgi:hypothetical protein